MIFPIEIRHIETGAARAFASLQEIADFLVGKVEAEWEGWRHMGKLPAPTVESEAAPTSQFPGEPALSPSPEGVLVEGAGVVSIANLQAAGVPIAPEAVIEPEPAAEPVPAEPVSTPEPTPAPVETLIEKIEHAVEDAVHSVLPGNE